MKNILSLLFLLSILVSCNSSKEEKKVETKEKTQTEMAVKQYEAPVFSIEEANKLIELPLHCVETEYPNKLGQTIGSDEDLQSPEALHPIFYGCFDWHSAVHGYWSMVTLVKQFPDMEKADKVKEILQKNITPKNVSKELEYFQKDINKSYERTYGWAWLLKLSEALYTWEDPMGKRLAENLQPLVDDIVSKYEEFLPKLVYPIRVGEHTNTAFGLTFAWDYANTTNNTELKNLIEQRTKEFYLKDENCPITWEPSGYDFLSPCLEEVDIMRRVLPKKEFTDWLDSFLPALENKNYQLEPGKVGDRSDGKLVHLDGLNFSRAWVLYGLANQYPEYDHLKNVANQHISYSYPNLVGDTYEGGHWLASFAIYALEQNQK
ncbi:MAG: hypothetical protein CMC07_04350 [Flavobacteriaceae bacterium]|mgnify:CR=1 FL=1|jgi:hypothetical protein|nr:hypothetical protein [Flavobacteriaceae bacterium]|tara:strand:+ start:2190 stop:3320 length:1131 start_codon:yes stop_codon:yes gene_type:complete